MFAVKAKIYGVLYNQASSIAFDIIIARPVNVRR